MLLNEILLDANLLVPNSINDALKVGWLNQIQRQLYRDFSFPDTSHAFLAETDVSLYAIPDNCSRERITSVIVGDDTYDYVTVDEDVTGRSWTMIENNLWIHPTPIAPMQAFLNYRPRPDDMRVEMQDVEPQFPADFHEILVFGIATRIARASQDSNKAAEMDMQFQVLHDKAKKALRPSRQKNVRMSRTWR